MTSIKHCALCLVTWVALVAPAAAQDVSFTPGTVWSFTYITVEPGQLQNYLDYLAGNWKKQTEFGKREGYVVSYHVLSVNNPRAGEPDLILAIEYKDYYTNAQQLDQQRRFEAFMASDTRKMDVQYGERKAMRKPAGSMELQELVLK